MKKINIAADLNEVPKTIELISADLSRHQVPKKEILRTTMMTEDVLTNLIEKASGNITLSFVRLFGNVEIHISAKGEKFDASAIEESMLLK